MEAGIALTVSINYLFTSVLFAQQETEHKLSNHTHCVFIQLAKLNDFKHRQRQTTVFNQILQQFGHIFHLNICVRLQILDAIPQRKLNGQLIFSIEIAKFLRQNAVIWIELLFRQTTVNDDRYNDTMVFDV